MDDDADGDGDDDGDAAADDDADDDAGGGGDDGDFDDDDDGDDDGDGDGNGNGDDAVGGGDLYSTYWCLNRKHHMTLCAAGRSFVHPLGPGCLLTFKMVVPANYL